MNHIIYDYSVSKLKKKKLDLKKTFYLILYLKYSKQPLY